MGRLLVRAHGLALANKACDFIDHVLRTLATPLVLVMQDAIDAFLFLFALPSFDRLWLLLVLVWLLVLNLLVISS